jgi:hypothetical protein
MNGEALERTQELVEFIKNICEKRLGSNPVLRKSTKESFRDNGARK